MTEADTAAFAPGPTNTYGFFDEATKKALVQTPHLYRQIIPPGVTNLAFVGFIMSPCNTVLT